MLGLSNLFTQMISYLNIVDLGIGIASTYALYKPLVEEDFNIVSIIFNTLDKFYKVVSLLILSLGFLSSLLLPYFIKNNEFGKRIYLYWCLYVIITAFSYLTSKYYILFIADQRYGYVRTIQGAGKLIVNTFQLLVLIYFKSFILYIILMIFETFICQLYYKRLFEKKYSIIRKVETIDKNIVKDMKNLFWHKISSIIVFNTDYIVLAKFTNLKTVAIYSVYMTVYKMVSSIIGFLTPALTPSIGKFIATNSKEKIYNHWRIIYSIYMLLGSIVVITTYFLISPFVNQWMGNNYELSNLTVLLILINLFIQITRQVTDVFKSNSGFYDDIYTPILESLINLILSIILVKKIGLNGVILGTVCSNILIIVLLKPILVFKRCFEKKMMRYLMDLLKFLGLSVLTAIFSKIMIENILSIDFIGNWIGLIIYSIKIVVISTLIGIFLFLVDKKFRDFLFDIIKIKILDNKE